MLFGLFASLLGVGYAFAKDKQKFNNMNANAVRMYGRGINESIDDMAITNKYFWEIKNYFDQRHSFYMHNQDNILNSEYYKTCQNYKDAEIVSRNFYGAKCLTENEYLEWCAGMMSFDDVFKKYAPEYPKLYENTLGGLGYLDGFHSSVAFSDIGRALARKELYRLGFLPAHMNTMDCKLDGKNLYFYNGCGYCSLGASAWDEYDWRAEKFKYNHHIF